MKKQKSQKQPESGTKAVSSSLKVLFADDEPHLQDLIAAELPRMGHTVTVCPDGLTAVAALEKNSYDCVLVDLDMPGLGGIGVIEKTKQLSPSTEAIVLTGKGSTETAIAALRLGAFDYLQKPCKLVELRSLLKKVATRRELNNRISALQRRLKRVEGEPEMIGSDRTMQRVKALIEKVAPTPSTVLIRGETGTGKELAARAVHRQSDRFEKPFVALNCGALPENLIESELFGHRKGAFTGAEEHRQGLFEVANGGTLFLDEIGELPKATQSKLLRVLESGEIRRVGDNDAFQVDVRIVCATHRDLSKMVQEGEFREDLMYRINTFEILLPPLRDRLNDIPELARHLLARHNPAAFETPTPFESDAIKRLQSHSWPGNIRELANVIEHASILSDGLPIRIDDLPREFASGAAPATVAFTATGQSLREIEMQAIFAALDRHNGNKTAAANELGISLKTLYNKLNQEAMRKAA
ncbi:MAG: sigma-54 dependent transcriptional regulator [Planctomycetota bacterium]